MEIVTVHFDTAGGSEVEDIEVKKGGAISGAGGADADEL